MSLDTAELLKSKILPSNLSINTADGSTKKVFGKKVIISISVYDLEIKQSFVITHVVHYEVILGLDWFEKSKAVLDPAERLPKLAEQSIELINDEF